PHPYVGHANAEATLDLAAEVARGQLVAHDQDQPQPIDRVAGPERMWVDARQGGPTQLERALFEDSAASDPERPRVALRGLEVRERRGGDARPLAADARRNFSVPCGQ